jgi:hypothetical protein
MSTPWGCPITRAVRSTRATTSRYASVPESAAAHPVHLMRYDVSRRRDRDALATPYDPELIAMSQLAFTLSGFERIGEQDFAQSWLVRFP